MPDSTPRPAPLVLHVDDLAALLGVTPAQVRHMRARGQLPDPLKKPGLGLCWRRTDIERWLARP